MALGLTDRTCSRYERPVRARVATRVSVAAAVEARVRNVVVEVHNARLTLWKTVSVAKQV
jgi:hypothetical protein